MSITLLFPRPVEEPGGQYRVIFDFQYLGHEVRSDAPEFLKLSHDFWAPAVLVLAERVDDEAGDWGEAFRDGERCDGRW